MPSVRRLGIENLLPPRRLLHHQQVCVATITSADSFTGFGFLRLCSHNNIQAGVTALLGGTLRPLRFLSSWRREYAKAPGILNAKAPRTATIANLHLNVVDQ